MQDLKVSRRNARERNRVKSVNKGFDMLKSHIPSAAPVKKMSKVNILSHAVEYIRNLQMVLGEDPDMTDDENSNSNDVNFKSSINDATTFKALNDAIKKESSLLDDNMNTKNPLINSTTTTSNYSPISNPSLVSSTTLDSMPMLSPAPLYAPPLTPVSPNTPQFYPNHPSNPQMAATGSFYKAPAAITSRFPSAQPDRPPSSYESGYESTSTYSEPDCSTANRLLTSLYSIDNTLDVKGHQQNHPQSLLQQQHLYPHHLNQHQVSAQHHQLNSYLSTTSPHHLPSLLSPQQSPVNVHQLPHHQTNTSNYHHLLPMGSSDGSHLGKQNGGLLVDSSGEEDDILDAIAEWQQE